jgi:hypothetical protein
MTLEELKEIRDKQSAKIIQMTAEERRIFYAENEARIIKKLGKDYFIPTDKPNIWRHVVQRPTPE